MSLSLQAGAEAADPASDSLPQVVASAARAALMGSRGNSGVILSQILAGFAAGVGEAPELGVPQFRAGLEQAARSAYASVVEPVEGTILTAIRDAAEASRALDAVGRA